MHPYRLSQQNERVVYTEESDEPGHGFIEVCISTDRNEVGVRLCFYTCL